MTKQNIANGAATPQGYSLSFVDLHGSTESPTYMGLYTLEKYDTIKCQQLCDAAQYCSGINIYIERDPSVDPGTGCDDPPSIANYKCTLFGAHVTEASATNLGGYRDNFHVVIAASNGKSEGPCATVLTREPRLTIGRVLQERPTTILHQF